MQIRDSVALVTGANRGIGARFVAQLVDRGAARVYAAARRLETLEPLVATAPDRILPLRLDITDADQVAAAARAAADVTLLVNNAGVLAFGGPLDGDLEMADRDMAVNYLGTLKAIRGFVPVIEANGGGAVANVLTIVGFAPMPALGGYCASKAAAHCLTQALRGQVADKGITVHGVYPAGVDTDMLAGVEFPKADPADVVRLALDGLEAGDEEILPDPISAEAYKIFMADPKALERQNLGV
jgi:NAD(P)-dependent dehydrogenase (short-subunit alcohol dehydrogenase family)